MAFLPVVRLAYAAFSMMAIADMSPDNFPMMPFSLRFTSSDFLADAVYRLVLASIAISLIPMREE